MDKNGNHVHFLDKMVLAGLVLGVVYWIIECLLYTFLAYEISFLDRLIGPDLSGLSTRIIVICFFLIFGSHAQSTINKRKQTEAELLNIKKMNEKLKQELEKLKNQ